MSFLKRLFRWKRNGQVRRIRICIECGMPLPEHKEWCAIYRTMQASRRKSASLNTSA